MSPKGIQLFNASWISVDQDVLHLWFIAIDCIENFAVSEGVEVLRGQEALVVKFALNLGGEFGGAIQAHPSTQAITNRVVHEVVFLREICRKRSFPRTGSA